MKKQAMLFAAVVLVASSSVVLAEAEVEDLGQPAYHHSGRYYGRDQDENTQGEFVLADRVAKIEQQVNNLNSQNTTAKFEEMQQVLQQLHGDIEKQAHDIAVLNQQQRDFFKDVNRRLAQLGQASTDVASTEEASADSQAQAAKTDATTTALSSEHQAFRDAFELLKAKQYDEAIVAFKKYLDRFPEGRFTVNAYYWLGEVYYLQGNAEPAKVAFERVVKDYPTNQKMPDAMLKLAIIASDGGDKSAATHLFDKIQKQFPGTTAARLAAIRAQELKLSS